ncbi:hypothetical protein VZ95_16040 [Elstera litoralis]|uniref:Uncharacterized protein n=1 Tax=Elstera litoralis TaxID=552518 RepID=A0A0F3IPQ6_9PROT|nr:hypothetical protein VZ95_16040 [Elstera litoralis]
MLVAQAQHEGLTLVSEDTKIRFYTVAVPGRTPSGWGSNDQPGGLSPLFLATSFKFLHKMALPPFYTAGRGFFRQWCDFYVSIGKLTKPSLEEKIST